jgi:hypothetical protein
VGAQGGAAIGYRWLFIGFELTIARFIGSADVEVLGFGRNVDLGSWIIYPGVALMGEF